MKFVAFDLKWEMGPFIWTFRAHCRDINWSNLKLLSLREEGGLRRGREIGEQLVGVAVRIHTTFIGSLSCVGLAHGDPKQVQ